MTTQAHAVGHVFFNDIHAGAQCERGWWHVRRGDINRETAAVGRVRADHTRGEEGGMDDARRAVATLVAWPASRIALDRCEDFGGYTWRLL